MVEGFPKCRTDQESVFLSNPAWTPLQSVSLANGTFYFSDINWRNNPARFYRLTAPQAAWRP
jgi:hypothetical protein